MSQVVADVKEDKFKPVDLNDLDLQNESELEINPEGDAFANPPPPPELDDAGRPMKYQVKLSLQTGDQGKFMAGVSKNGEKYIKVGITATITEPGSDWDERFLFDGFVSTMVRRDTGTSRMAGILKACGVAVPAKIKAVDMCKLFEQTLGNEPACVVRIQWEAYSPEEKKACMKGQRTWADPEHKGQYLTKMVYKKTTEELTPQARILEYLPLSVLS